MGQDDSAPVPIRLENGPESSEPLDCILDLIKHARTRVWLKVAWWNVKSDAGRDLGRALVDAHKRGVDTRVIMRNDADGLPMIARLREAGIEVRPSRYIHEKELLVDDEYLVHSMNFTGAETERNTQVGHLSKDKAQVDANVARFVDVWEQFAAIEFQRGVQESVAMKTVVPDECPLLK